MRFVKGSGQRLGGKTNSERAGGGTRCPPRPAPPRPSRKSATISKWPSATPWVAGGGREAKGERHVWQGGVGDSAGQRAGHYDGRRRFHRGLSLLRRKLKLVVKCRFRDRLPLRRVPRQAGLAAQRRRGTAVRSDKVARPAERTAPPRFRGCRGRPDHRVCQRPHRGWPGCQCVGLRP